MDWTQIAASEAFKKQSPKSQAVIHNNWQAENPQPASIGTADSLMQQEAQPVVTAAPVTAPPPASSPTANLFLSAPAGVDTSVGMPSKRTYQDAERQAQASSAAQVMQEPEQGDKGGWQNLQATLYGAAGIAGQAAGIDKVRDAGFAGYQRNTKEAEKHKVDVQNFTDVDWESLDSITDWVSGTLGQLAPSVAESVVTAGIGAALGSSAAGVGVDPGAVAGFVGKTGVRKLIRNQIAKTLKKDVFKNIARTQGRAAARKAAGLAVGRKIGASAGAMEGGGMWGEDAEKHGVEDANWASAAGLGLLSGASELVAPGGRFARSVVGDTGAAFLKELGNPVGKKLFTRLGIEIPKSMVGEGAQEAVQSFIGKVNEKINDTSGKVSLFDKESLTEYLNAAAAGAVGGGFFGSMGAVRTPGPDGKTDSDGKAKNTPETGSGKADADRTQAIADLRQENYSTADLRTIREDQAAQTEFGVDTEAVDFLLAERADETAAAREVLDAVDNPGVMTRTAKTGVDKDWADGVVDMQKARQYQQSRLVGTDHIKTADDMASILTETEIAGEQDRAVRVEGAEQFLADTKIPAEAKERFVNSGVLEFLERLCP